MADFVRSDSGTAFLSKCRDLGLAVEYELHAVSELLPRDLFAANPGFFRMDDAGERTADANLCVHSQRALDIAAENAVSISHILRPTTGRYFLWGDDGLAWCRCPLCRGISDSDQALILENHLIEALRKDDLSAQIAHLAYVTTLTPPKQVKPKPGVFLEFAPIHRKYGVPLDDPANRPHLEMLDANLKVFGSEGAQALEYWLDVSLFSSWKRPAVRLDFDERVLDRDLEVYGSRGSRHITTFAVYIDADYVIAHGDPPVKAYGALLSRWHPD
jgi:hypothetical protein